jgi:hypothetical protein
VPAVPKDRYYSVMLEDGNTFIYGYIGSRATGSDAGNYMVVGPTWNGTTPAGTKKVFRSTTKFSLVGYRTQLFGPKDIDNVKKIQAGYKVQPLSAYLKQRPPAVAPKIDFPKVDKALGKERFFDYVAFSPPFAPPGPEEQAVRANLAKIGVAPASRPTSQDFRQKIENGWKVSSLFGDRAGDWLKRTAGAQAGIYGNAAVEAAYPYTKDLANGQPVDGSKHATRSPSRPGSSRPSTRSGRWRCTMARRSFSSRTRSIVISSTRRCCRA